MLNPSRILPLAAVLTLGCASYKSSYVPPADGRARALWDDNKVVMAVDSASEQCLSISGQLARHEISIDHPHSSGGGVAVFVWVPGPVIHPHPVPMGGPVPTRVHGGPAGHGHPGATGGNADAYKALLVVVLVAAPIVAYALALSRPEPEDEMASAVDRVNAYNDLSRAPGSPCSQFQ